VENCTITGPVSLGPLADANGGINRPTATAEQRAKREQLLRRTQRNVTFKNCTIDTTGVTVEMGVQNLTFDACRIHTSQKWLLRLNKDEYEPWRNIPTGKLDRLLGDRPIDPAPLRARSRHVWRERTRRSTRHASPTSRPPPRPGPPSGGSGGAVPGELPPPPPPATRPATMPATSPDTQPSVRRFDLIDATSGAVLRELKDG
jgi:hypothetical protein